jgi:hypothetical protein
MMSYYCGGGFDEWVEDSFFSSTTKEQFDEIKALLEPYRESIDNKIVNDFEPKTMSWRAYRYSLWMSIPDVISQKIAEVLRQSSRQGDNSSSV